MAFYLYLGVKKKNRTRLIQKKKMGKRKKINFLETVKRGIFIHKKK